MVQLRNIDFMTPVLSTPLVDMHRMIYNEDGNHVCENPVLYPGPSTDVTPNSGGDGYDINSLNCFVAGTWLRETSIVDTTVNVTSFDANATGNPRWDVLVAHYNRPLAIGGSTISYFTSVGSGTSLPVFDSTRECPFAVVYVPDGTSDTSNVTMLPVRDTQPFKRATIDKTAIDGQIIYGVVASTVSAINYLDVDSCGAVVGRTLIATTERPNGHYAGIGVVGHAGVQGDVTLPVETPTAMYAVVGSGVTPGCGLSVYNSKPSGTFRSNARGAVINTINCKSALTVSATEDVVSVVGMTGISVYAETPYQTTAPGGDVNYGIDVTATGGAYMVGQRISTDWYGQQVTANRVAISAYGSYSAVNRFRGIGVQAKGTGIGGFLFNDADTSVGLPLLVFPQYGQTGALFAAEGTAGAVTAPFTLISGDMAFPWFNHSEKSTYILEGFQYYGAGLVVGNTYHSWQYVSASSVSGTGSVLFDMSGYTTDWFGMVADHEMVGTETGDKVGFLGRMLHTGNGDASLTGFSADLVHSSCATVAGPSAATQPAFVVGYDVITGSLISNAEAKGFNAVMNIGDGSTAASCASVFGMAVGVSVNDPVADSTIRFHGISVNVANATRYATASNAAALGVNTMAYTVDPSAGTSLGHSHINLHTKTIGQTVANPGQTMIDHLAELSVDATGLTPTASGAAVFATITNVNSAARNAAVVGVGTGGTAPCFWAAAVNAGNGMIISAEATVPATYAGVLIDNTAAPAGASGVVVSNTAGHGFIHDQNMTGATGGGAVYNGLQISIHGTAGAHGAQARGIHISTDYDAVSYNGANLAGLVFSVNDPNTLSPATTRNISGVYVHNNNVQTNATVLGMFVSNNVLASASNVEISGAFFSTYVAGDPLTAADLVGYNICGYASYATALTGNITPAHLFGVSLAPGGAGTSLTNTAINTKVFLNVGDNVTNYNASVVAFAASLSQLTNAITPGGTAPVAAVHAVMTSFDTAASTAALIAEAYAGNAVAVSVYAYSGHGIWVRASSNYGMFVDAHQGVYASTEQQAFIIGNHTQYAGFADTANTGVPQSNFTVSQTRIGSFDVGACGFTNAVLQSCSQTNQGAEPWGYAAHAVSFDAVVVDHDNDNPWYAYQTRLSNTCVMSGSTTNHKWVGQHIRMDVPTSGTGWTGSAVGVEIFASGAAAKHDTWTNLLIHHDQFAHHKLVSMSAAGISSGGAFIQMDTGAAVTDTANGAINVSFGTAVASGLIYLHGDQFISLTGVVGHGMAVSATSMASFGGAYAGYATSLMSAARMVDLSATSITHASTFGLRYGVDSVVTPASVVGLYAGMGTGVNYDSAASIVYGVQAAMASVETTGWTESNFFDGRVAAVRGDAGAGGYGVYGATTWATANGGWGVGADPYLHIRGTGTEGGTNIMGRIGLGDLPNRNYIDIDVQNNSLILYRAGAPVGSLVFA